jgi:hypothetical protein
VEKIRSAALHEWVSHAGNKQRQKRLFFQARESAVKLIVASAIAAAEKHERDVQYFKRH